MLYLNKNCLIDDNPSRKELKQYFINDDTLLMTITKPLINERVLKCDVERTKVEETQNIPQFKQACISLLTHYCNTKHMTYVQGLSEIMGTFLLIKFQLNIPYHKVYNLFVSFIDYFIPNVYSSSSDISSLQTTLKLIDLLLKYHDIRLYNIFKSLQIFPELYAGGLLLTMFAHKWKSSIVCYIWDKLIQFRDKLFPHLIIIAMLRHYKQSYTQYMDNPEESIKIASYVSQINVDSVKDVETIIEIALSLNNMTPVSYRMIANNVGLFNRNKGIIKEYEVDQMEVMSMFPSEIVKYLYACKVTCYDNKCACYLQSYCTEPDDFCEYCKLNYVGEIQRNLVIIDIRNKLNMKECDYLIGQQDVKVINVGDYANDVRNAISNANDNNVDVTNIKELDDIYKQITTIINMNEVNDKHFVLLTNYTDYYDENKYKHGRTYHTKLTECNIEVTRVYPDKNFKHHKRKSPLNETIQNENLLLDVLVFYLSQIKQMNYISIAYGGYSVMHNIFVKYSLNPAQAKPKCAFCKSFHRSNSTFKAQLNKLTNGKDVLNKTHSTCLQTNTKYYNCYILIKEWQPKVVCLESNSLIIYTEVNNDTFHSDKTIAYSDIYEIKKKYSYQKVYIYLNNVNSLCCYSQLVILEFKEKGKMFFKELESRIRVKHI